MVNIPAPVMVVLAIAQPQSTTGVDDLSCLLSDMPYVPDKVVRISIHDWIEIVRRGPIANRLKVALNGQDAFYDMRETFWSLPHDTDLGHVHRRAITDHKGRRWLVVMDKLTFRSRWFILAFHPRSNGTVSDVDAHK